MYYEMHVHSPAYLYDESNAHEIRNIHAYTTGALCKCKSLTGLYNISSKHEKGIQNVLKCLYDRNTHICMNLYISKEMLVSANGRIHKCLTEKHMQILAEMRY